MMGKGEGEKEGRKGDETKKEKADGRRKGGRKRE